jgi:hypothetical protein
MIQIVTIDTLIEKLTKLFPDISKDAIPLTLLIQGCLPKSPRTEDVEEAITARMRLYNRLLEIEDEVNRAKELHSNDISGGIRS